MYDKIVENPYEESGGNDEEALTGVVNIHFPAMRTWIKEYLKATRGKVGGAPEHDCFLHGGVLSSHGLSCTCHCLLGSGC